MTESESRPPHMGPASNITNRPHDTRNDARAARRRRRDAALRLPPLEHSGLRDPLDSRGCSGSAETAEWLTGRPYGAYGPADLTPLDYLRMAHEAATDDQTRAIIALAGTTLRRMQEADQ